MDKMYIDNMHHILDLFDPLYAEEKEEWDKRKKQQEENYGE